MFESPFQLKLKYDFDDILNIMKCDKNSNTYPVFMNVFEDFIDMIEHISLIAYVDFDKKNNKIYCLVSLGSFLEKQCKKYYADDNYLESLVLDEIGTQILFNGTVELYNILKESICEGYLSKRQEKIEDVPKIVNNINLKFNTNIEANDYGMIAPLKSMAYYYNITENKIDYLDRTCEDCEMIECKNRKHTIRLIIGEKEIVVYGKKGQNLLNLIRDENIHISAFCNGKGTCGKCKVWLEKLEKSVLACNYTINNDETIIVPEEKNSLIESSFYNNDYKRKLKTKFGIGIDIGTTTVVFSLVNQNCEELEKIRVLNPQISYGSDVISRIEYARNDKEKTLTNIIRKLILENLNYIVSNYKIDKNDLEIVISANTTMIYLLLDLDVESLATAPFIPLEFIYDNVEIGSYKIKIIPWISGFVGGDILSGLSALPKLDNTLNYLYIDIGTNGEMALISNNEIFTCATAAGPTFEGANISCGCGSIEGAINHIKYNKELRISFDTINNKEPVGICGSGIIELVSELINNKLIDETGLLENDVQITENIIFTPKDVRQVQLAKAAIAGGMDTLLQNCNLSYDDINIIYLAGGFGSAIDIKSACNIGLLSKFDESKIFVLGNMSLGGAIKSMYDIDKDEAFRNILEKCKYIELSQSITFNDNYIENMLFSCRNT